MDKYYNTISGLSKTNIILLVLVCFTTMPVIWGYGWGYSVIESGIKAVNYSKVDYEQNFLNSYIFSSGAKAVQNVLIYIHYIIFLIWIYKFQKGLSLIRITNARWSPGWCVAWWFIPIMNLFRPYQVMAQIWRATNLHTPTISWNLSTVPPLLMIWWIIWILSSGGRFSFFTSYMFSIEIILQAAVIISNILLIFVIKSITEQLKEKITQLEKAPVIEDAPFVKPETKEKEIKDFEIVAKQKPLKEKPSTETTEAKPSPPKVEIITKKKT